MDCAGAYQRIRWLSVGELLFCGFKARGSFFSFVRALRFLSFLRPLFSTSPLFAKGRNGKSRLVPSAGGGGRTRAHCVGVELEEALFGFETLEVNPTRVSSH